MQFVKLNLARNCLKYIIKAYGIKEIFIPFYSCSILWEAVKEEGCFIKFYHIDKNFMPLTMFDSNAFILYINYFGLCSGNCKILEKQYKNLIVDNTHSFYSEPMGIASFNSLRKFFRVPNGAYLYTKNLIDARLETDDLNISPILFHEDMDEFVKNELLLNEQKEIKELSSQVDLLIHKIDFEKDKQNRVKLYKEYSKYFYKDNKIELKLNEGDIPYCYPFCPKDSNSIDIHDLIILRLWNPIPESFVEYSFLNNTMALPLNDVSYAEKIIRILG
ncbi:hypothetical protein HDR58_00560 [bacterium]|nr:hypothetical protein [bacterium]